MARITASQISLMKQLFAQVGAIDSTWITGDIPVDQIGGATNWFTDLFDTRIAVVGPTLVTTQGQAAEAAAVAAQATADLAYARTVKQSGCVHIAATQTMVADGYINDLTASITVTETTDFMVHMDLGVGLDTGEHLLCYLEVDGANDAVFTDAYAVGAAARFTSSQSWKLTFAPGTHVLKLWGVVSGPLDIYSHCSTLSWWQL